MGFFDSAREGELAKVTQHLANGVDIDAENVGGATALEMAAEAGRTSVVEFLLAKGARVDPIDKPCFSSALILAATYHHAPTARLLLKHGADPNIEDEEGQTALIWAAAHGAPMPIVEALVASGADVDHKDDRGHTAVEYAAHKEYTAIVAFLRRHS